MASTNWELLVSGEELLSAAKNRERSYIEESFSLADVPKKLSEGWQIKKEYKKAVKMMQQKKVGDAFEDELWTIFYEMGFTVMNATNKFDLYYSDNLHKQIDIVAIDDETCLFVECKEAVNRNTNHNFNFDISEIGSKRDKLYNAIREKYPNRKCKYIFATKNYVLGDQDKNRLNEDKIPYFEYSSVLYYKALASYLGKAARFQLLGFLFSGQRIIGMDSTVPAIRGYMPGGLKYYTFLIEPEKLLKLGYVLHRTNANNDYSELLPSYQRLIKKDRLDSVRKFVNDGGFFPNSVIISIETKKEMQFDFASGNQNQLYKMGLLHLPQNYQSAYIIDGQHRIYGYSDSEHSNNNTIPVVAFENLDKEKQLKLFIEINQNQKAISTKLRGLLEIDVYYNDEDPVKNKPALLGKIAKRLGEDPKSPLKGRVIIGEDAQTSICCITMEYIKAALEKTNFFNTYKNKKIVSKGVFDKSNNDETMAVVYPLIRKFFQDIAYYSQEWKENDSYITKNNSIVALLRVFGDLVDIVISKNPEYRNNTDELYKQIMDKFFLDLIDSIDTMPVDKRQSILKSKGEAAKRDPYRILQMVMHEKNPEYTNNDIERYYVEHVVDYNDFAKHDLVIIRKKLSERIKALYDGENWEFKHMSEDHQKEFTSRLSNKKIANMRNGIDINLDKWEELTISDIYRIISFGSHWINDFKSFFEERGYNVLKSIFVSNMKTIAEQQKLISNGSHVTKTNYDIIHELCLVLSEKDS